MIRSAFVAICLLGPGLSSAARGQDEASQDIVDTAIAAGTFKTFVQAVDTAGLTEVLKSPGPFTVLAPNDEAFAALPKGTLDALLKDKQKLASVITYHFIPGKAMSTDVMKLASAKSAQGELLAIKAENDAVRVNSAKLLKTDVLCSNGVIHVIDAVLLPPKPTPPAVKQAKAAIHAPAEMEPAKRIAELKMVAGDSAQAWPSKNVLAKEVLEEALCASRRTRRRGSDRCWPYARDCAKRLKSSSSRRFRKPSFPKDFRSLRRSARFR